MPLHKGGFVMNGRKCARMMALLLSGTFLLRGTPLAAQRFGVTDLRNAAHLGIGYVANFPNAFAGAAILAISPKVLGGAGLYADVKFSPSSPAGAVEYLPTVTVDQAENVYGDRLFLQRSAWFTANLAAVYAVTRELALYAGAGYSREHHYREYFDNSQTRGLAGFYWVYDAAASGTRINALGGVLLRAGRYVVFQSGVGARPAGVDAGVMFTLPL